MQISGLSVKGVGALALVEALTTTERLFLEAFLKQPDGRLSHRGLLEAAWPHERNLDTRLKDGSRSQRSLLDRIYTLVKGLRAKLRPGIKIKAVRGFGYALIVVSTEEAHPPRPSGSQLWIHRWPQGDDASRALIHAALRLALARGHHHIGLEHLALAQLQVDAPDRVSRYIQECTERNQDTLNRLMGGLILDLDRAHDAPPVPRPTPRLRRYGAQLNGGFSLETLWGMVARDQHQPLRFIGSGIGRVLEARTLTRRRAAGGTPSAMMVEGGPEDGRLIPLGPGMRVGRWSPEEAADRFLYKGSAFVDQTLSRTHLLWLSDGRAQLSSEGHLMRAGRGQELKPGEHRILPHDLLWLTRFTCVLFLDRAECPTSAALDLTA